MAEYDDMPQDFQDGWNEGYAQGVADALGVFYGSGANE
jgi:hypothetical protein